MADLPPLLDDFQVRSLARDAWRRQLSADAMLEARLAGGAAGPRPQPVVLKPGRALVASLPAQPDLFGRLENTSVMPSAVQGQNRGHKGRSER